MNISEFICVCKKLFETNELLQTHKRGCMEARDKNKRDLIGKPITKENFVKNGLNKEYFCDICEKPYKNETGLEQHRRRKHKKILEAFDYYEKAMWEKKNGKDNRPEIGLIVGNRRIIINITNSSIRITGNNLHLELDQTDEDEK